MRTWSANRIRFSVSTNTSESQMAKRQYKRDTRVGKKLNRKRPRYIRGSA